MVQQPVLAPESKKYLMVPSHLGRELSPKNLSFFSLNQRTKLNKPPTPSPTICWQSSRNTQWVSDSALCHYWVAKVPLKLIEVSFCLFLVSWWLFVRGLAHENCIRPDSALRQLILYVILVVGRRSVSSCCVRTCSLQRGRFNFIDLPKKNTRVAQIVCRAVPYLLL